MMSVTKALVCLAAAALPLASATDYGGRIFTIGHFSILNPYGYINEAGNWVGAGLDMVRAACDAAGAECNIIHLTTDQCWDSNEGRNMLGPALMGGLVDACAIYTETPQRKWSADFSESLMTHSKIYIWHETGDTFTMPITSAQNLRVGFLDGAYYNEAYLRNGHNNAVEAGATFTSVNYGSTDACFQGIVNDEVDMCLSHPTANNAGDFPTLQTFPGVELSSPTEGYGAGIMLRKDNRVALDMLNNGIRRIKSAGLYKTICENYWPLDANGEVTTSSRCLYGAAGV